MADEPNEQDEGTGPEETAPEPPAEEASASDAPEPPAEEAGEEEAPAEEPAPAAAEAEEPAAEEPAAEEPAAEEPAPAAAEADEPAAEEPAPAAAEAEEPAAAEAEKPAAEEPAPAAAEAEPPAAAAEAAAAAEQPERRPRPPREEKPSEPEVVPGAHLEPDLVLEESRPSDEYADPYATDDETPGTEGEQPAAEEAAPRVRTPLELAADARYRATGKRKRAVARVILKPGTGTYTINGRELDAYFPRTTLQRNARLPLESTGNDTRMDVVAKIHGGGVSSQAIALRHGISRALVEADPNLRTELKRQGFLTRDARVKERKKAGLKKARKRPQFSKR